MQRLAEPANRLECQPELSAEPHHLVDQPPDVRVMASTRGDLFETVRRRLRHVDHGPFVVGHAPGSMPVDARGLFLSVEQMVPERSVRGNFCSQIFHDIH